MSMLPPLVLELRAKAADLYSEIGKVKGEVRKMADETEQHSGRMEGAFDKTSKAMKYGMLGAATAVAGGLALIGKVGMEEAMDASAGTAQLEAGIKSTGNAAGVTVGELNEYASSIQNMSGQTDDSVVKAQQLLLTFTNINNNGPDKIFDQATLAAANMAAKMGGDAASQAVALGKALNDPTAGISKLTRVGVTFTDAQKAQVEAMQASGDMAGAQGVILKELSVEFGGAAEAAGNSLPGMLARGRRAFEDLSQTIVTAILPIITPVIGGMITLLQGALPRVQAFTEGFGGALTGLKSLIVGGDFTGAFAKAFNVEEDSPIVGVILTIREAVLGLWTNIKPVLSGIGALFSGLAPTMSPLIPQVLGLLSAFSPLTLILKAVGPVIPQIVSALTMLGQALGGALAAVLPTITQLVFTLVQTLSGVFATILPIIIGLVTMLASTFVQILPTIVSLASTLGSVLATVLPVVGQLLAAIVPIIASLLPPIMELVSVLVTTLGPVLQFVLTAFMAIVQFLIPVLIPVINILGAIVTAVFTAIGAIVSWLWTAIVMPVVNFIMGYLQVLGGVYMWLWKSVVMPAIQGIGAIFSWLWGNVISPIVSFINMAIRTVGSVVASVFGAISGVISGAFGGVIGIVKNIVNTVIGLVNGVISNINGIGAAVKTATGGAIDVHIGKIPSLDIGGTIPGGLNQPTMMIGHGREEVLSNDMLAGRKPIRPDVVQKVLRNAGGDDAGAPTMTPGQTHNTVTVTAVTNASPAEIAASVGWELRRRG